MNEWDDLADDELEARLRQRGVDLGHAELLVHNRDVPHFAETIDRYLER